MICSLNMAPDYASPMRDPSAYPVRRQANPAPTMTPQNLRPSGIKIERLLFRPGWFGGLVGGWGDWLGVVRI